MAWIMTAVAVVGTVTSVVGQLDAADAAEEAGRKNSEAQKEAGKRNSAAYLEAGERNASEILFSGRAEQQLAEFQSSQMVQGAGQARAVSQIAAADEERKAAMRESRALAVAGVSGGGVADPTVLRIISGLSGEGALASATQLFAGSEQARILELQAAATLYGGSEALKTAERTAANTKAGAATAAKNALEGAYSAAEASLSSGRDQASANRWGAASSFIQGAGSMYSRFGGSSTPQMGNPDGSFSTVKKY